MSEPPALRRVLTFWPLVFYGLSVIVGAGIYVSIGAVIGRAGNAAPLAFLLAGLAAALTGLCYAEWATRAPEAAGAVAYVRHAFGSARLSQFVGLAVTTAVAVGGASIARGAVQYLALLLPLPPWVLTIGLVAGFTWIATRGVRESVGLAAGMGLIEIAGLVAATAAGLLAAPEFHFAGWIPAGMPAWRGTIAGGFIAFFAFIGFETLASLAEEVKDPQRTLPRGILGAVAASVLLYVAVSSAAVLADSNVDNPLTGLFHGVNATVFIVVSAIAVSNGVLVQIVMLARLFYGMADKGQLPRGLARVDPVTLTPKAATWIAGAIVLAAALLVPFEHLLVFADAVTLGIFAVVDVALWHVQRSVPPVGSFHIPRWLPLIAAAVSVALILAEFLA